MTDIVGIGEDLMIQTSQVPRAANLLQTQIGALEYAPDFGIDLRYFLDNPIQFQTESFKAYLVERLANYGINVAEIGDVLESVSRTYTINLAPEETSTGMITR